MTHAHDILSGLCVMPTSIRAVDEWERLTPEDKMRLQTLIRHAYQSAYYRENIERARAYQVRYNSEHRKPNCHRRGARGFLAEREEIRMTFTIADIMESSVEKTERMIGAILAGKKWLVV